jgi:hypothetical protein
LKVVTKILLGLGGILFAVDGIIKIVRPDFTFLGMSMPCGVSMILVGLGLVGLALQK